MKMEMELKNFSTKTVNCYLVCMKNFTLSYANHPMINSAKNAIHVNLKDIVAHRALVSCYSLLGREEDARTKAVKVLQIDPNFSVDRFAKISPLKNKDKAKEIWPLLSNPVRRSMFLVISLGERAIIQFTIVRIINQ